MRSFLFLKALGVCALVACSCGSSSHSTKPSPNHTSSASTAAGVPTTHVDADKDTDFGTPRDDRDNSSALKFGHEARAADRRAIASAVKRYYEVALAGNGAAACKLIYSPLAESVVEDYGESQPPGPSYMRGATCAQVLDNLFKHFHAKLVAELPQLQVKQVRLEEHHGVALLDFGTMPERQIAVTREGPTWRMAALFDAEAQ